MNITESRKLYVEKVIESIPSHINPVDYLVDALGISKVSVYRRLKCILPFTYDEIIILSTKLSFSLDAIVYADNNEEKAIFSFKNNEHDHLHDYFKEILILFYSSSRCTEAKNQRPDY